MFTTYFYPKKKKNVYNLFSFIFIFIFYILNLYYLSLLIGTNRFLKKKKKKKELTGHEIFNYMNKNGEEEEENRPHKIVRKEGEEDEHRGVKISSTKMSF